MDIEQRIQTFSTEATTSLYDEARIGYPLEAVEAIVYPRICSMV